MLLPLATTMEYYTYAYLREDGTPYYIGKGKSNRIYQKRNNEIKPPEDKSRIIFLKQNLTEKESFKHEIYMIAVLGRKDLGTGILRNKTNGGEGLGGLVRTEEHNRKISASKKGRSNGREGCKHSEETISKIRDIKTGLKHSEESRAKISKSKKGIPWSPKRRAAQEARRISKSTSNL